MKFQYPITILASCLITYLLTAHFSSKSVEPEAGSTLEMSKRIIGTWIFDDDLAMTFYPNGNWSCGDLSVESDSRISCNLTSSGEYCVAESGVFLRHFGTMHWHNSGDYTDINTSIGAEYLTFKDNALIDNQEDYEIAYVKETRPLSVIYEITSDQYINTEGAKLLETEGEVKHLVYPDETLDDLARYYQVPKEKIMNDNGISDEDSLKVGKHITITADE